jgi:hypothetical protein
VIPADKNTPTAGLVVTAAPHVAVAIPQDGRAVKAVLPCEIR